MKKHLGARRAGIAFLIATLLAPQVLWAESAVDESPDPWAMAGDLVVARPLGAVITVGGAAVWLVSLPFTLLAGHAGEAADKLIIGPGAATFARCLGCRNTGYTYKDIDAYHEAQDKAAAEDEAAASE